MTAAFTYESDDVMIALGRHVGLRGREIVQNRYVLDVKASTNEADVMARVRNAEGVVYDQRIGLSRINGRLRVRGSCTCPVGLNCKHVAAALFAYLAMPTIRNERQPQQPPGPRPTSVRAWLDQVVAAAAAAPRPEVEPQQSLHFLVQPSVSLPGSLDLIAGHLTGASTAGRTLESTVQWQQVTAHGSRAIQDFAGDDTALIRSMLATVRKPILTSTLTFETTAEAALVLKRLIGTGRMHVGRIDAPPVQWGPSQRGAFRWIERPDGLQVMELAAADTQPFAHVLTLGAPLYVSKDGALIGPIETGVPNDLAALLLNAPAVGPTDASMVRAMLSRAGRETARSLPLPESDEPIIERRVLPKPHLHLSTLSIEPRPIPRVNVPQPTMPLPVAKLTFAYSGVNVAHDDPASMLEQREDGGLVMIVRDMAAEAKAIQRLTSASLRILDPRIWSLPAGKNGLLAVLPPGQSFATDWFLRAFDPDGIIEFVAEQVPKLIAAGWTITYDDEFPYQVADGDEAGWWADASTDGMGIDWVSFELGVLVDGVRINIVPHLVKAMDRLPGSVLAQALEPSGETLLTAALKRIKLYATLPDKRLLRLPPERLAPMLRGMLELVGPRRESVKDGKVRLHRAEAGALANAATRFGVTVAWSADATKLVNLGRRLSAGRGSDPVALPSTFRAQLRAYQADGVAWMTMLQETQFGGVLADDMGLGKTVQALAFLAFEKAQGHLTTPALIVAPTSVLPNWMMEAARFAPTLKVLSLRGADRQVRFPDIPKHDLVLTTYPLLMRDAETLLAQDFHVAILDEAQAIKNPRAAITGIAHRLPAKHRFALTGTPLENNLGEVWSLFEFLTPGLLGDEGTFRRVFRNPIEKYGSVEAQRFLTKRLKPFMLRRTKQEVATELPPKTEIVERITLEGAQRDLYETVRVMMEKRVREEIAAKGLAKSHIIVLDALLKMRQVCCDPRLLKLGQAKDVTQSAKLERLVELLPEMVAEGRRILLFSQFTTMLDLIAEELRRAGIGFVALTGSTVDRAAPVELFQTGKVPVFLLSLKAGGTGLNLTAADTVIHYDPWWNPAVEAQATDRAYRIGQDKPVFVYKLMVEEGIEEAMEQLKTRKAALAEALFEGGSKTPMSLSEDDIAALFRPMSGSMRAKHAA